MTTLTEPPVGRLGHGTDRGAHVYVCTFGAVLYAALLIAPLLTSRLSSQYGLTATQIGTVFSVEMAAFSLAAVPAYLWSTRANLHTVTYLCTTVVVGGNIVSAVVSTFPALVATRAITAAAAGSITVIILSISGRTSNPGRSFGMFVVAQLSMGALALAVLPRLFPDGRASSVYWTLAALTAAGFAVVHLIDGNVLRTNLSAKAGTIPSSAPRAPLAQFVLGMAAIAAFYVALSGAWTFVGEVAEAAGADSGRVSAALSVATVAGIASALLATVIGDTPRQRALMMVGYLGFCLSILLLLGTPALTRFVIAAVLFKFSWTFVLPFLFAGLSRLSTRPYVMSTTNLMIGAGFAGGPVLAGALIDGSGGYQAMLLVSFAVMVTSAAFAGFAVRPPRRTSDPMIDAARTEHARPAESIG